MSAPAPSGWSSLPSRLSPISGGIVLALTATTWLQKTYEASPVDVVRTYTLWGLLSTVSHRLLFLLIIAIVLLLASAVAGIVLPPDRMLARSVLGWLAVAAVVGIVVNSDNGHAPGAGAIVTLVVCSVTALVTTFVPLLRSRSQQPVAAPS
ncbi:hypothetical protein [Microlunatus speluncae]|uniref:hypothetical protein n=1 Tax=Microlunatus speluncae TaxID=2594267 RepID=UPI001266842A|nr:hypothetical protein [Microlunatus speluncae]